MANGLMRGAGGAAQGAAAGSFFGPLGTGVGAGLGFLGGLFAGDGVDELPPWALSPDALKSINFSDIDLKTLNPELYEKLLQNNALLDEYSKAYAERRQGLTNQEERRMRDDTLRSENRLGAMGLAGTGQGEAMMADVTARARDAAMERAYQEKIGLLQGLNQAQGQNFNMSRQAMGDAYGAMVGNRDNAYRGDIANRDYMMGKFENNQNQQAASNQFWSGLFNNGMQGLGNLGNMNMQQQFAKQKYGIDLNPWGF